MNRPASVKVLGQTFDVEFQDTPDFSLAREGHAAGSTSVARLRILIDADQHEMQLRDTALHEVIHASLHVQELGADDEAFVARLAPVLLDVLRSNPHLVAWLTE